MRAVSLACCAAVALLALPLTAQAQGDTAAVTADARCLMTMAALASVQDETRARLGQAGVVFFAGRIKAREPGYNFATRLKPVADSLNGESVQSEAQRCGPLVVDALKELRAAQESFAPAGSAAKPPASGARPPAASTAKPPKP